MPLSRQEARRREELAEETEVSAEERKEVLSVLATGNIHRGLMREEIAVRSRMRHRDLGPVLDSLQEDELVEVWDDYWFITEDEIDAIRDRLEI